MKYCPECASETIIFDGIKRYRCRSCGWDFFKNPAAAVAGLLECRGKIVVVRRSREPGKGMLDFPGGFVDPDESLEEALQRELREELQTEASGLSYLCSAPNVYKFNGITYSTCDSFFTGRLPQENFVVERAEIAEILFLRRDELMPEEFAFPSLRVAIEKYTAGQK